MSRHMRHFPELDPLPLNPKQGDREAIQAHVDAFLARGGQIQQIEYGRSGEDKTQEVYSYRSGRLKRDMWIITQDRKAAQKK